ncbi:nucleoside triphosphate pyrophosphohydrolase [candidate division WOR-1 bacterium RIFCSPLOWO2_02_FULL_46_20]|uniref:Nucleoside triphosphate pyrophosphohydrolase n=2 Tax=Saganbacteria TaxID=1703751 RepID=A0A1F4R8J2_UNCSA|nr:MAG: nucleoside triphosphate pyrophosphohydrolase [candidate division WOR-1 bacterium RIFCSPHIGHO2_02_FULL_45_12]OGC04491.1 MAG: nucleoside triphosphate pyrophosphohydrolase [candidate division WOR-1 bacterium RIFCSPLOWO2_02_FULL_46_20]OGC10141.1 MAG: nucleoside triphosphate pyrophosphohydrolase [candidate division WOR-1 bacterium RIFCSPLOWO2_12_FULL_45_9]
MKKLDEFVRIVRRLRKQCPWDREQTFESLKPFLVEEVYEAISAIDDKDYDRLGEELGDMLLHIVMLSVFAEEGDHFDIIKVIDGISAKMVRRHPHVFANGKAKTKEQIWLKWEKIKAAEKKAKGKINKGMLDGVPRSLPALYRAEKVQRRAARVGFDWDQVAGAWDKVHEELDEVKFEIQNSKHETNLKTKIRSSKLKEEIGDLLFAVVNVARKLDIDAEDALQQANSKFMGRFFKIEKKLKKKKLTIEQMDALWDKIKASES